MGLFDSVWVECPCGTDVEFQTKVMPSPHLETYPLHAVPSLIADDLNGATEECETCGRHLRLHAPWAPPPVRPPTVIMRVEEVSGTPPRSA